MNDFTYRWCLNEEDYRIICGMMVQWNMFPLHRRMLSEYGAIVSRNGIDICSGWLYQSDSKIAWIEWVVMNKKSPRKLRIGSLDFLYEILFTEAKKLGYEIIMSLSHEKKFENFLVKKQFKKQDFSHTNILYKNLWE